MSTATTPTSGNRLCSIATWMGWVVLSTLVIKLAVAPALPDLGLQRWSTTISCQEVAGENAISCNRAAALFSVPETKGTEAEVGPYPIARQWSRLTSFGSDDGLCLAAALLLLLLASCRWPQGKGDER